MSLNDIYHPQRKINFSGAPPNGLSWINNTHYILRTEDPVDEPAVLVDARSQKRSPLYDWKLLRDALAEVPSVNFEEANHLARQAHLNLTHSQDAALIPHNNDLFYYRFGDKQVIHVTNSQDPKVHANFSPNGRFVSYIKEDDLHLFEVDTRQTRVLTNEGGTGILSGRLTWVYQEELYGRDNFRGYWWSPNSKRIAFLRTDLTGVSSYSLVNDLESHQTINPVIYPLPGTPNPKVSLHIVEIAEGREVQNIDTSEYKDDEPLIVRVAWCPGSEKLTYQVQDRQQTWLDLNLFHINSGLTKKLLRETSPSWVKVIDNPRWLRDDTFLWRSERSGWQHIYHYQSDGTLIKQITNGKWEVRDLYGVDEDSRYLFIKATTNDPTGNYTYRIDLDGANLLLLTTDVGTHQSVFSTQCSLFLDYFSTSTQPTTVRLHESSGTHIQVVYENSSTALDEYHLGNTDFLQVHARDGFAMEAMLITPPEFNPSKRYPVLVCTYGGPGIQKATNSWNGDIWLWHQMLAQKGYIVWICDNRSASSKGATSAWPVHRELGKCELQDIEDGLNYLRSQSFVDADRIGLWGWSYGGYLTAYALTHSKSFKMGIAGAPVTDWTLYDSIYTERYMSTPERNPEGYKNASVLRSAQDLDGRLLIIHGMMDDNVHIRNSLQLIHALQQNKKTFNFMLYPGADHKIDRPNQLLHVRALMTDFVLQYL